MMFVNPMEQKRDPIEYLKDFGFAKGLLNKTSSDPDVSAHSFSFQLFSGVTGQSYFMMGLALQSVFSVVLIVQNI